MADSEKVPPLVDDANGGEADDLPDEMTASPDGPTDEMSLDAVQAALAAAGFAADEPTHAGQTKIANSVLQALTKPMPKPAPNPKGTTVVADDFGEAKK